jgi:hypothetical protein
MEGVIDLKSLSIPQEATGVARSNQPLSFLLDEVPRVGVDDRRSEPPEVLRASRAAFAGEAFEPDPEPGHSRRVVWRMMD